MTLRRLLVVLVAFAACQHPAEAQAADPKSAPSAPAPKSESPTLPSSAPSDAVKPLADKAAKDAAAKAIAALPACSLKPATGFTTGRLQLVAEKCTELRCIRTCCNTCTFAAAIAGDGPQRGLSAKQFRQLFPAFAEAPLECEINAWNSQLKSVIVSVTAHEEKSADRARAPLSACLQAAER